MIKIRALRTKELKQVLNLLREFGLKQGGELEFEYSVLHKLKQLYVPMQMISQLLPIQFQFLPAIFVAVARERVLGLIWISQDGRQKRRWKIEQLILDPQDSSYDVGTQLINYVINRYGGEGVQTFLAHVDQYHEQALGLLKSCGFRRCTRLHYYGHENPAELADGPSSLSGLRPATNGDCEKLRQLHSYCLPTETRVTLEKTRGDFYQSPLRRLSDRMKGVFFKRWVMEDEARDILIGAIDIATENYRDFYLSLMLNPGWQEHYESLLRFGVSQVLLSTGTARIFLEVYDFGLHEMEVLEQLGFQRGSTAEVLVKDYWIPLQDRKDRLSSPIMLFSGRTSPAVNCRP